MSHGKVITKDKVNIPDWVGTNLYLENDWVVQGNKIYRANDAIPVNTPFTTGTVGATWTEMSPSAATPTHGYGTWSLETSYDFSEIGDATGTPIRIPFDLEISAVNATFDAALNMFGLTGAPDNAPYVSIAFTIYADHDNNYTGSSNISHLYFGLGFTDDLGMTWQSPPELPIARLGFDWSPSFTYASHNFLDVAHVPGRKYALWGRANSSIWRFIGGTSSLYDFLMPGGSPTDLATTSITISAFG